MVIIQDKCRRRELLVCSLTHIQRVIIYHVCLQNISRTRRWKAISTLPEYLLPREFRKKGIKMDTKAEAYDKRMEGVFYLPEIPIVPQYPHSSSPEKMNSVQQAFIGLHVNEIPHQVKTLGSTAVSNQEERPSGLS